MSPRVSLALLCCFSALLLLPMASPAASFSDVPKWHWAWRYIQGVNQAGIATGYLDGTYRPEVVVTRDQMAVYIARALAGGEANVPSGPLSPRFPDVQPENWAYKHIEYCADPARDVVRGYEDGTYRPEAPVNRGAMAAYVSRAIAGGDAAVPAGPAVPTFEDVGLDYWAYRYVEYCADPAQAVVKGYLDGTYRPEVNVTRDQMAVYMCRAFDLATPSEPYNVTDYFPLTPGRTWTYRSNQGLYTAAVSGTVDLSGQRHTNLTQIPGGAAAYCQASADGLRLGGVRPAGAASITFDPAFCMPNGLDPGAAGTQTSDIYQDGSLIGQAAFSYRFLTVESVTAPVGVLDDCLKVEVQLEAGAAGSWRSYVWLAKGLGVAQADSRPFGGEDWAELVAATWISPGPFTDPFDTTDHYPLGQGDRWAYLGTWGAHTSTISGTTQVLGVQYANKVESDGFTQYWRATPEGLTTAGFSDGSDQIILDPPLLIPNGMTLKQMRAQTTTVFVNGVPTGEGEVVLHFLQVDDVLTPAGHFPECMKLDLQLTVPGASERFHQWLAKGLGEVKWDDTAFGGNGTSVLESATVGGVSYP